MLLICYSKERPGPGWHRHGTTSKRLAGVSGERLLGIRVLKQRWLHVETGRTRHDRPVWDSPNAGYALDVVVLTLYAWLFAQRGLEHVDWPWDDSERPSRRTVQRWKAALEPRADDWLQTCRTHLIDHVAPRPLEDLLPAAGVPPPRGVRPRNSQESLASACKLRDVIWLNNNTARALSITLRALLVVARWRWTRKP